MHKKIEKLLYLSLAALLLLSMLMVSPVPASPSASPTTMSVVPSKIENTTLGPTKNFSVNITALNVTDLYSFEFKLWYNTSVLNATSVTQDPTNWPAPPKTYIAKKIINNTIGLVWVSITRLAPLVGIPGPADVLLATIVFNVTAWGHSALHLQDTVLSAYALPYPLEISHDRVCGVFSNEGTIHDVAVISVTPFPTMVVVGRTVNVTVVAENEGTVNETFTVTAYYDNTTIATPQGVTNLPPGNSRELMFIWNTTGVPFGFNYTIKAVASVVSGETLADQADNTKIDGTVLVYAAHDMAVINVTLYSMFYGPVDRAYNTSTVPLVINVTVKNVGNLTETFNVTLYYDYNFIGNITFTGVAPGAQAWSTFNWIITGIPPSVVGHTYTTYAIRAEAVLADDENPVDNKLSTPLWMKFPGDADGSGFVDIGDFGWLGAQWFKSLQEADFDGSGFVDIGDFGILGAYWFKGI